MFAAGRTSSALSTTVTPRIGTPAPQRAAGVPFAMLAFPLVAPLVALSIEAGDLVRSPRLIEEILQLVECGGASSPALSTRDHEAERSVEPGDLCLGERSRHLFR
jgi:hypothetical protein